MCSQCDWWIMAFEGKMTSDFTGMDGDICDFCLFVIFFFPHYHIVTSGYLILLYDFFYIVCVT